MGNYYRYCRKWHSPPIGNKRFKSCDATLHHPIERHEAIGKIFTQYESNELQSSTEFLVVHFSKSGQFKFWPPKGYFNEDFVVMATALIGTHRRCNNKRLQ